MWCATCKKSRDKMAADGLRISCSAFYYPNRQPIGVIDRIVAWLRTRFE